MKKFLLIFVPFCAMADFTSTDSTHLLNTATATQQTADKLDTANTYLSGIDSSAQTISADLQSFFNAYSQYTSYGQYYTDSLVRSLYSYNLLRQGFSTPSVNYLFLADTDIPTTSSSAISSTSNQSLSQYFNLLFGVLSTLNNSQTANAVDIAKRIRDVRICAATLTNLVADVRSVNRGISNIVDIVYSDNKRYHDVITNLWKSTFKFPAPSSGNEGYSFYGFNTPNSRNILSNPVVNKTLSFNAQNSLTDFLYQMFTFQKFYFQNQLNSQVWVINLEQMIYRAITNLHLSASNSFDRMYASPSVLTWGFQLADSAIPDQKLLDPDFVEFGTELNGDFFHDVIALQKTRLKQDETSQILLAGIFNNTAPTNPPNEMIIADELNEEAQNIKDDIQQVVHDWSVDFGEVEIDAFDVFQDYNFSQLPQKITLDLTDLLDDYAFFKNFDDTLQNQMRFEFDPRDYLWFFQLIRGCSICVIILSCVHMFGIALRFFYNVIYFAFFAHPNDN